MITDGDVDRDWQLKDLDAMLRPYLAQVRELDAQFVETLEDTQESGPSAANLPA